LAEWGVPEGDIRYEAFGPASVPATATPAPDPSAQIVFARSGTTVSWQPADSSVLQVAAAHGIVIDSGCCTGKCGTCETAIRSGTVSYKSPPAYKVKEGSCLPCIARPTGRLIIDA
jgi:uncharacterized protein